MRNGDVEEDKRRSEGAGVQESRRREIRFESGKTNDETHEDEEKEGKGQGEAQNGNAAMDQRKTLEINKRKARFSEAEIRFFREAAEEGSMIQTHFADPSLDCCFRRPLCDRIINGENLS